MPSPTSRPQPHRPRPQGSDLDLYDLDFDLAALTSSTSAARRWPQPRRPQHQGGDLGLSALDLNFGDLALDLDLGNLALDLDYLSLGLRTAMTMSPRRKAASHPRREVAPGRKATSHPRQELAGNLQSWLQLWFCSSLRHLACVLQLNRSSIDAYVAYGVFSRIIDLPFLGSDLGNSVSGL
jgi:hypothetical protein